MCAYAEALTHDPQIKSRMPIPLSYRGHEQNRIWSVARLLSTYLSITKYELSQWFLQ